MMVHQDYLAASSVGNFTTSPGKSVNFGQTRNRIYLADNLEVLRLLVSEGNRSVDTIYIDPPYGRRHSDTGFSDNYGDPRAWMDFLKPRLAISRELLTDDGVIMVSMDDSRVHWLRVLMDEIFGESNYVNTIVWHHAAMSRFKSYHLRNAHEYILVYAQSLNEVKINRVRAEKLKFRNVIHTARRLSKYFGFSLEDGLSALGIFRDARTGELFEWYNTLTRKQDFLNAPVDDIWYIPPLNRMSREYIRGFLGQKPVALIKRLLRVFGKPNGAVLDYFAGTGTVGEAVLDLNFEDGGQRSFILVQNSEETREESLVQQGYRWISEILLERMHKVSNHYDNMDTDIDNGFQVYEY